MRLRRGFDAGTKVPAYLRGKGKGALRGRRPLRGGYTASRGAPGHFVAGIPLRVVLPMVGTGFVCNCYRYNLFSVRVGILTRNLSAQGLRR